MPASVDDGLAWHDGTGGLFQVSGLCWYAAERVLRRLPQQPAWPLRDEVDHLANHTAGAQLRFRTDASTVAVRYEVGGPANASHMPASGQCGIDAYVEDGDEEPRYWGTTVRPAVGETSATGVLFHADTRDMRTVSLNLPLYQSIRSIEIGLDRNASISSPRPFRGGRVIFYGTSITQGGCASRPGTCYPSILSRRLDAEVVNLGFDNNGRGDAALAQLMASIDDVACYVLDFEINVSEPATLATAIDGFLPILRDRRAETPIVVVSRPIFARELHESDRVADRIARRAILSAAVERHRSRGDRNIHLVDLSVHGVFEHTVDGLHPTDMGMHTIADWLEGPLRSVMDNHPTSAPHKETAP